jgi:DNA-binding transcriptional ArsR family regulator
MLNLGISGRQIRVTQPLRSATGTRRGAGTASNGYEGRERDRDLAPGRSLPASRRRRADRSSSPRRRLPDEALDLIVARLKVMAEPNWIRLMELLNDSDATVQELTDRLMTTHQNVSKHLGALYQAGMVSRRREGPSVRYSLIDWTGWWVVEQIGQSVAEHLDELREALAGHGGQAR